MASTGFSKKHKEQLDELFKLNLEREYALNSMEDGLIKDWIIELKQRVSSLQDDHSKLLKATGNSAFNPTIY